ncbi:MAG: lecithin retinol acyltransferase family protein [Methylomicrobium sp.]
MPIYNGIESFIDGCRHRVIPDVGSVLYCDLAFGYMDHSGIYIGDNKIVHLARNGKIQFTTPRGFINGGTALHIYVSCSNEESVGSPVAAERAKSMIGSSRNYHVLLDNCHQFTCGCLTGNFDNTMNYLWMLKKRSSEYLKANTWRYWDIALF